MITQRDEAILRHIARHRLSIREVLQELFFKSEDACGSCVAKLLKTTKERGPLIDSAKFTTDGNSYSYYQLTEDGARAVGLKEPPRVNDERSAHAALAALWFCHMVEKTKLLLTEAEEQKLLGAAPEGVRHCIQPDGDWSVLHELYVPAPHTKEEDVIDRIRKRIDERRKVPVFREWIASRNLGFAVLVEREERRDTLRSRIGKADLRRFTSVIVELAPGASTLRSFIDARKRSNNGT